MDASVDSFGLFVSLADMAIYLWRRQGGWQLAAVTIFVLAGFTKQALITIPLACLLLESFLNGRRMLAGFAWGAGLAPLPLILMQYPTHGPFLLTLLPHNLNPMEFAG